MNSFFPLICFYCSLAFPTPEIINEEDRWRDASVKAIEFLLQAQEGQQEGQSAEEEGDSKGAAYPIGEWPYEGVYRERGQIPPGYRVGGTAIVLRSLIESLPTKRVNFKEKDPLGNVLLRGLNFLLKESLQSPAMGVGFNRGYDVRDWGHIECLETLLRLEQLNMVPKDRLAAVQQKIRQLIDTLIQNEIPGGGWNYSRSRRRNVQSPASPFMTGPAVMALLRAKEMGYPFDGNVVIRALKTIENARIESGAIQYSTQPDRVSGEGFEALEGACARMAVSELALFQVGMNDIEKVRFALKAFFDHWKWLERRRAGTGTHNPPYYIAPYYFFYAHLHTARAIKVLPKEEQKQARIRLLELLWQVRDKPGTWNDRVFPRSAAYGTAMTLLALNSPKTPLPETVDIKELEQWGQSMKEAPKESEEPTKKKEEESKKDSVKKPVPL
ncbi:MAG: hypothetical protein CBC13_11270 [Planctomycetia bacterium TMED53]|nr:MAG: hypothetical protein CBC13_11270 [Planctomycetia bacterium TMED53]